MPESEIKFNKLSARFGAERTAAMLEGYRTGRGAPINHLHNFFYRNVSTQETKIINLGAETLAHLEVLKTTDDTKKQQGAVRALSETYCLSKTVEMAEAQLGIEKASALFLGDASALDVLKTSDDPVKQLYVIKSLSKMYGPEEAIDLIEKTIGDGATLKLLQSLKKEDVNPAFWAYLHIYILASELLWCGRASEAIMLHSDLEMWQLEYSTALKNQKPQ